MDARIDLDLNDVALLVRVVQTQSFSAAARERGVPVSTVSRRIARLESALGIRLLERTTRRLRLTDAGRAYFAHAERAVDDLAQGTDRVRELQIEPRGRVRILAPPTLALPITNALYDYMLAHALVAVDLQLGDRKIDFIEEGYDIAIRTGRVEDSTEIVARAVWAPSRKLLYASPRYLRDHGALKRLEDLPHHDCIATEAADGQATWPLGGGGRKKRITFAPRLYVSEFGAAHRAAVAGLGITLMPEILALEDVAKKRLVQVLPGYEGETGGVSVLYRAHRSLTAAVRTCVDHLVATLPASDPGKLGRKSSRRR